MLIHFLFLISLHLFFFSFEPVTTADIRNLILSSSKSTCLSDPVPSKLLPYCIDVIVPVVSRIINLSLSTSVFSNDLKSAFVKPLKKTTLDSNDIKNYRSISNLSFLSKLIERVIANQLQLHLSSNGLMSEYQSAYRKFHSSETVLLRVRNDILVSLDSGHSTALLLLDLSAAFDIVDQNILLHLLKHWFGIISFALSSLSSFLTNRFQTVVASNSKPQPVLLELGISQDSVLGPLLYSLYTTPLHSIILKYPGIRCHFYADDTQIYISFSFEHASYAVSIIESCIKDVFSWLVVNILSANPNKTEYLLFNSRSINPWNSLPCDCFTVNCLACFKSRLYNINFSIC